MRDYLKYFRWVALAGIFVTPFIVLYVSTGLFFPFITGKNFLFRIIVEIIFGCWAVLAIYDKQYRPRKNYILYAFYAFVFFTVLSAGFGVNPYRSFWSNFERMEGVITFLHLLAYFLVISTLLNKEKLWNAFFITTLSASVIVCLYGFLQLTMPEKVEIHQGGVRLDASLGNAAYLAIYTVFHAFIALVFFFKKAGAGRWFFAPVFIANVIILYYTATRGAILGFVGGMALLSIILLWLSKDKKTKKIGLIALASVAVVVIGFWLARNSTFVKDSAVLSRFSSISPSETTTQSRLVIWKLAWQGFKERPVLGWGLENFNLIFNKYYQPILWKQEAWFDRAHNVFFDRLTTGGVLGLAPYLALFGSAAFYLLIKRKEAGFSVIESAGYTGLLAAYFFHNIFVFDNLISLILFAALLAYVAHKAGGQAIGPEESFKNKKEQPADDDLKKPVLALLVLATALYSTYFFNAKAYAQCKTLLSSLRNVGTGNYEEAFKTFQAGIDYGSFGTTETREQLNVFASQVINSSLSQEIKQKAFTFAVDQMEKQIAEVPNDIRYMAFLGSILNRGGQFDGAIKTMTEAIKLSPNKQLLYFELINAYLSKGDLVNAEKMAKFVNELDPDYPEGSKVYAIILIRKGNLPEAKKVLKQSFGEEIINDEKVAQALAAGKYYPDALKVYETLLSRRPENIELMMRVAALYLEMGQKTKSIEILQKAISVEPRFKQQGEYYINEIKAGRKP